MQIITPQRIHLFVVVTTFAVSAFSLASLFGRHPYLELATHFRLQYALAASACVVLLVVFHSWRLIPLALCSAIFNWTFIIPYYAASRPISPTSVIHLRLMHANVLGSNKDYAALTAAVEQERPDILLLQEYTQAWHEHLQSLNSKYPYSKAAPRQGGSGMALFSRYPLEGAEVLTLDASAHLAILSRVIVDGSPLSILSLHPPTPMRPEKFANRNEQFTRAAAIMRGTQGPKLLIGDLNTTMWSPYFVDLVRGAGLRDARQGFGLKPSWPVPLPALLQIPIDHCLVGGGISAERVRTGGRTGSDHRPLVVDVSLERSPVLASR
jgi:endonuclease/exonuclease/phosphatase (EEP) superfamily protein YafD